MMNSKTNNNDAYDDSDIFREGISPTVYTASTCLFWPNADPDHDGLPPPDWEPPSKEQEDLELNALVIGGQFANIASRPWDAHDTIGLFGLSLLRLARKKQPERLSGRSRDKLFADLEMARQALREGSVGTAEDKLFLDAMDAAFVIANHLGETNEERASRHPHVMLDAIDRLQIAVNTARSHGLYEDIRRRADSRIAEEVGAMVASSLQAAGLLTSQRVANRSRRHG